MMKQTTGNNNKNKQCRAIEKVKNRIKNIFL